jgi:hypothetical protein
MSDFTFQLQGRPIGILATLDLGRLCQREKARRLPGRRAPILEWAGRFGGTFSFRPAIIEA